MGGRGIFHLLVKRGKPEPDIAAIPILFFPQKAQALQ
jgi:hypothetical protein